MSKNRQGIQFVFLGIAAVVAAYLLSLNFPPRVSSALNDSAYWYTHDIGLGSVKNLKFKFIGVVIDEYSLSKVKERWPWKRGLYAQFINILSGEGVNTLGIDFALVGESEDKEQDRLLAEALKKSSARIILPYFLDYKNTTVVFPPQELKDSSFSLGMVNTPQDPDGKIRRLRGEVRLENQPYYSFAVALAASFLNKKPEDIIPSIPLLKDRTFLVNYLIRPDDIIRVSFFDIIYNLKGLKGKYGQDFLKGALVVAYPEAGIFHDLHYTPLGGMPGGIVHLNGAMDIILNRFLRDSGILTFLVLALSLALISFVIPRLGFLYGLAFVLGTLTLDFWVLICLSLIGLKFDFSRIVFLDSLLFLTASAYKYSYFLAGLIKIKDKATLDPLRGLFTLRYFYYRMELELKKIYFGKDTFLVFIYLGAFKEKAAELSIEAVRNVWGRIRSVISIPGSFWSVYSAEELAGCLVGPQAKMAVLARSFKSALEALFKEQGLDSRVGLSYLKMKRDYPQGELLSYLSAELKKRQGEGILFLGAGDLKNAVESSLAQESPKFLEGLQDDIEEKNRQLLSMIEELKKEHDKIKEAFFEIIASLVNALEARDPYTQGHSQRVANYALMLADGLGWPDTQKEKLKKAAVLHDIGKIGIPDSILHKKGKLNDEEYDFIKKHQSIGVKILEPLKDLSDILPWIMYHHERWDGKGYPYGLAGDAIPEAAQIIALADVFDALTTGRDYKIAFVREEAIKELARSKGTHFNPGLTDLFIKILTADKI